MIRCLRCATDFAPGSAETCPSAPDGGRHEALPDQIHRDRIAAMSPAEFVEHMRSKGTGTIVESMEVDHQ